MSKEEAVKILEKVYSDLKVSSIIEYEDKYIANMVKKNGESIIGGTKGIVKDTGKVMEINPLRHKGLVKLLMEAEEV